MGYKQDILRLRSDGKSYREIMKILGCSSGTISYYCNDLQKDKQLERNKKFRKENPNITRIYDFRSDRLTKISDDKKLQSTDKQRFRQKIKMFKIDMKEFLEKINETTECYLSGRKIDPNDPSSFQLDHILPRSRGGSNEIENMGIASSDVNLCKRNLTPEEFIELCKDVVEYNGYEVIKK